MTVLGEPAWRTRLFSARPHVIGPTLPSATSPRSACQELVAPVVLVPKTPSIPSEPQLER